DRMQFQAALALIRARPGYYLQWVAESLRIAPAKLFTFNATLIAVGWVLLVLGLAWLLAYAFRRIRQGPGAPERVTPPLSFARELNILLVLGLGVAAGQCLMVAALVASQLRYYDTAGVFLPGAAVVLAVALGTQVWSLLRPTPLAHSEPFP